MTIVSQVLKRCFIALLALSFVFAPFPHHGTSEAQAAGGTRTLWLHFTHTGEEKKITFRRNGKYVASGLKELNWILRDWRRKQATKMDPRLFDLIWSIYQEAGAKQAIRVVSGFRSKRTNDSLRRRSRGVAKFSQHTAGKAMDFYIPGVSVRRIREIGLRMQVGGVGYYPGSRTPFVHMDTGRVRHWPRMTPKQLATVFPKGKTLHVSTNGRKLPRYAQALAEYNARKTRVVEPLSRSKRRAFASADKPKRKRSGSVLASLFGNKKDNQNRESVTNDDVVLASASRIKREPKPATKKVISSKPTAAKPAKIEKKAPAIIANKVDEKEAAPIPSRIGRPIPVEAPRAPIVVAAIPPAPRAVPTGLREQFVPAQAIVVAENNSILDEHPGKAQGEFEQPQVIASRISIPQDNTPEPIDLTQTAALSREDFDIPTPEVVRNRLKVLADPTQLVLNEPSAKPKTLANPARLAYAIASGPVDNIPGIDADHFDSRFGKFKINTDNDATIRRTSLPPLEQHKPSAFERRFAALDTSSINAPLTLNDFKSGPADKLTALRRALQLAVNDNAQAQFATLPPIPVASPRTDAASLRRNKPSLPAKQHRVVEALFDTVSVSDEIYVSFELPKPNHMPSLFIQPNKAFAGSFSTAENHHRSEKFAGDAILVTPTIDFKPVTGFQLTWLKR